MHQMLECLDLWSRARPTCWALGGINATFDRGITAVVGPNGSGKTTLIRHLATSKSPTRGRVCFEGRPVDAGGASPSDLRWYRSVLGYMPQHVGLYPNLSSMQFVRYMGELKCIPQVRLADAACEALSACGIDPACTMPLQHRSEGERRRTAFASAVVGGPRVLLLDEPMASCDPVERVRIKSTLASMESSTTCVISASSIADVDGLCNQLLVLADGKVSFAGHPEDLVDMARGSVFVSELSEQDVELVRQNRNIAVTALMRRTEGTAQVRVVAARPGLPLLGGIGSWREAEPSLEEAYLWHRTVDSSTSYRG